MAVEKPGSVRVTEEAEAVKEKKDVRQLSERMRGLSRRTWETVARDWRKTKDNYRE
jgi:hypothetical protein